MEVQFPARAKDVSFLPNVQTGSGNYPFSYAKGIRSAFPEGKATGAPSLTLVSMWCSVSHWMEPYLHSHIRLHSVHRLNLTFTNTKTMRKKVGAGAVTYLCYFLVSERLRTEVDRAHFQMVIVAILVV
jgi:hypothetical protein